MVLQCRSLHLLFGLSEKSYGYTSVYFMTVKCGHFARCYFTQTDSQSTWNVSSVINGLKRKKKRVFVFDVFHNPFCLTNQYHLIFYQIISNDQLLLRSSISIDWTPWEYKNKICPLNGHLSYCSPQEVRLDIKFKFCVTYAKVDISNLQKD